MNPVTSRRDALLASACGCRVCCGWLCASNAVPASGGAPPSEDRLRFGLGELQGTGQGRNEQGAPVAESQAVYQQLRDLSAPASAREGRAVTSSGERSERERVGSTPPLARLSTPPGLARWLGQHPLAACSFERHALDLSPWLSSSVPTRPSRSLLLSTQGLIGTTEGCVQSH